MTYGSEKEMIQHYRDIVGLMMKQYHKIYESAALHPDLRELIRSKCYFALSYDDHYLIRKMGYMQEYRLDYDYNKDELTFCGVPMKAANNQQEPKLIINLDDILPTIVEMSHFAYQFNTLYSPDECKR